MSSPANSISTPLGKGEKRRTRLLAFGALALLILLAVGIVPRITRSQRATETASAAIEQVPVVNIVPAKTSGATSDLELPGNTEAINVARIYARASGYIRQRRVDIGARVKAGQVLAVIESPELDQQVEQARANLEQTRAALTQAQANLEQAHAGVNQAGANVVQARANQEIAATTNDRWTRLVSRGVLPKQAGDERRTALAAREAETQAAMAAAKTADAAVSSRNADVLAAKANIDAQAANVRRLERMQAFERVLAPFDGVVTERKIEQGDLVAADSGGDRNLFSVAQGRILRIQVNVPQAFAVDLRQGQPAEVFIRERPNQKYTGKVARTAQALNASSRTLLTEVQVDNANGELLPGMYAQIKFALSRFHPAILVPGNALIANSAGTRVVVVGPDNRAHYQSVQVGRDMGSEVEILSGLAGTEQLIANPPDTLVEGQTVQKAEAQKQASKEKQR